MWQLLALSPWRVVVAIAWGVAALGSGLALAALAAWLIARAWQMPPVLYLSVAVTSVRALGISRGLCRYLERLASHDVALRAMTSARTTVYRTLAHSDIWWWRTTSADRFGAISAVGHGEEGAAREGGRGSAVGRGGAGAVREIGSRGGDLRELRRGDLLVRIGRDIDDLGAVVVRVLVPVAVAVVLSLAAVVLIAFISVPAAVILAAALAVSGMLAPWLSSLAAREADEANQADRAEFTAEALTVLDHAPELRVAGKLDAALAKADAATGRAVRAEDTAAAHSAWAAAATPLSIGVSALGALLVGIAAYGPTGGLPGGMTPMALTILVLVPLSAFEAVGALPAAATTLTTSRAALHRLRTAESGGTAEPGRVVEPGGAVEASRTSAPGRSPTVEAGDGPGDGRTAPDGADARRRPELEGVGAERIPLPEGRRIAVVGPSGAGKTTLLMAWAGLFDTPRDGVTFFAEDAHLFSTSILENLRVARGDLTTEEAEDALREVGLGPWLDSLAEGVHTALTGGAAAVSGGQRRRILLARALVAPAHTLLLDEPTEHLAAAEGETLLRELLDAHSGLVGPDRTVVVVTHQLPADHRADTVVTVDGSGVTSTTERPAQDRN
ncbi:thiol reductant ABC exporter subunit CydC [Nocardia neocaledoniensis]|uniref:thiol reductant ABC exporter subunit CydC n=1 Tax=Nocardia neocaledoniensis TaxID=236511 RepID=UPI002455AF97|nr:thiol reductant ABC exporter subunit CydC [Nocardia neocaledoniensis]